MKNTVLTLITFALFTGLSAQADWTTKTFDVSSTFTEIVATSGINLKIQEGPTNSLTYACNNKEFLDLIKVDNSKNRVTISKENKWRNTYKNIKCEGTLTIAKDPTYVESSHGTNLSFDDLDVKNITIVSKHGSNLNGSLTGEKVTAISSEGSNLTLSGSANSGEFTADSGSNLEAKRLPTKTCTVDANQGSNASVNASSTLTANANQGSHISYKGSPATISKSSKGGSNIGLH